jgi:MarR-like DNA-binding transcriptional regulator SgrR of sgrS sRNA
MLSVLFDDRGEVALSLSHAGPQAPPWQPVARPPFAPSSAPRLSLAHDRTDPRAASIAARLRESLKLDGVELSIRARDHAELVDAGTSLILLAHRPPLSDPILALLDSLWTLGGEAEPEIARLERASRLAGSQARRDSALQAERALLAEARLVPLVRLQSWLACSPSLVGVDTGPPGVIDLRAAWWRP